MKSRQRDTVLLALEMEEGGREPRNVGDPRRWKRSGNAFLPAHPPRASIHAHSPADALILALRSRAERL